MGYVHIPVVWENPTRADLIAFFAAMDEHLHQRVLVHCAANMRASVFIALYRIARLGWDPGAAWQDVRTVWEPNEVWAAFMHDAAHASLPDMPTPGEPEGPLTIQPLPPARDSSEVRARHEGNRAAWNEGACAYTAGIDNTIAFLKEGNSNLHPIERANLGDLRAWCHTAIHLQCASGRDTLSLWNEGVQRVIGIDISDVHIDNARRTSVALGAPAEWFRCDVLDTPHTLDGTADLVYTGRGALGWLHDLDAWAAVVYRLLKPGGVFHVLDEHPANWLFDTEARTLVPTGIDYFSHGETSKGWPATYIGDIGVPVERQATKYEHLWTLSAIFQALRGAGLTVEQLGEYPDPYWDAFPNLPPDLARRIPMTFSMLARR
ncbi:MAG: methyltransferase domain-containing protein [Coriobacteriia bacterium]